MALLLKKILNAYNYLNYEYADPRVTSYPLMSTPFPMFFIIASYLYFVQNLGPKMMKNRQPFNIKKLIILYNIGQIFICGHIFYMFMKEAFWRFSFTCEPVDYSTTPFALLQVRYSWYYFMIKILDLLDTVFFVLRKKQNHVSFLHVYHHSGMVLAGWVGVKYIAGGHGLYIGAINCFVHSFMYLYYLLSIWDERFKTSIWWKKHITQLQLVQFLLLCILVGQTIFYKDCTYPKWVAIGFVPQNFFILCLFADFYYKNYIKQKPQKNTTVTNRIANKEEKMFASNVMQSVTNNEQKNK